MKYKNALVTGGAGFIGSHIVDLLIENGTNVIVYDNFSVGKLSNLSIHKQHENLSIVKGDILDFKKLKKAMKNIDIVFHNAAKVTIRNSVTNFIEDAQQNIIGTLNIIKAINETKVKKVVYASSMAVYGEKKRPCRETDTPNPISPYGISKLSSEKYILNASKNSGFDSVILRYFNTYGPRQAFTPYVGVITIFVNRLLNGKSPIIFGNGNQIRDFVHVSDIANSNITAMRKNITGEIFNIGTGKGTTVNEIAAILKNKINPKIKLKYGSERRGELRCSVADISKAKNFLGYDPKWSINQKIDEIIDTNKLLS